MDEIRNAIVKSIKESKWLSVEYENTNGALSKFWCSILDIDIQKQLISVHSFNRSLIGNESVGSIDLFMYLHGIKKATVIENTVYDRPSNLIEKIESNIDQFDWLGYDQFSDTTLDYLRNCMKYENIPYKQESALVPAIDDEVLKTAIPNGGIVLTLKQIGELFDNLEVLSKQDKTRSYIITELILNSMSIHTHSGIFVVAYYKLLFNPWERTLKIDPEILFNYEFANDQEMLFKHSLHSYLDIETDEFVSLYHSDRENAKKMLQDVLVERKESIDDRPYIMDLLRNYNYQIDREMDQLITLKHAGTLTRPLKAFFGNNSSKTTGKQKNVDIVLVDGQINIDQLRVIYHSFNNPVTYVQGPPGTGKTKSIINTLVTAFFNEETVLVASNNNKPIDDIYQKLQSIKSKKSSIPWPVLRLGNLDVMKQSLQTIRESVVNYDRYKADESKLENHKVKNVKSALNHNHIIAQYERKIELDEQIAAMESLAATVQIDSSGGIQLITDLNTLRTERDRIEVIEDDDIKNHVSKVDPSFLSWLFFTSIKYWKKLRFEKYRELLEIIMTEDEEVRLRAFIKYLQDSEKFELLLKVFPIIITTNQSVPRLGLPLPYFDLTIIDEAGQCAIGPALFPIMRGKRLLLVGDESQLRPVISLPPEINRRLMIHFRVPPVYSYVDNSILQLMHSVDSVSDSILLRYHYRCHKDIIGFSNQKYYHGRLIVPPKAGFENQALFSINSPSSKFRSNERNTSLPEIDDIINHIKNHPNISVGIITPFRNQANLIKDRIVQEKLDFVDVGTVHTFQGDEKEIIYMSAAITAYSSPKTFDWVKNNQELINVATTRAKKEFILVGDLNEISRRSENENDFNDLTEYVKHNGMRLVVPKTKTDGNYLQQINTNSEKELLQTIEHILTMNTKLIVRTQVKVSDVIAVIPKSVLSEYSRRATFDFVIYSEINNTEIPRLLVELDGPEHHDNIRRILADGKKEELVESNSVPLIRIPNSFSRRYVILRDVIMKLLTT